MIATLDRLMALSQKLRDAERAHEQEPIYLALDRNEIHLLERTLDVFLSELDTMGGLSGSMNGHSIEAYD